MKTLRQLIAETRLPTAKGELDFYKAHVDNIEIIDDPDNANNPDEPTKKKNLPKTYTGLDPKGGRLAEAINAKDKRHGKLPNHHPVEGTSPETPLKEDTEYLTEDEMARRAYVYERIFTLIDDISEIVDEFYTEEKDYENAINKRTKAYRENPDKDPKIPYPEYPARPWSIGSTASSLDEIYQTLLGNTNRDVDHVYEEVSLVEMKKPELFKKANETVEAQHSLKTKVDKAGTQDATGSDTVDYAEETQLTEISRKTLGSYIKKASADSAQALIKHGANKKDATSPHAAKIIKKLHNDNIRHINKRQAGIGKATDKLTREETEVEQIDEISQKKLTQYTPAAHKSADSLRKKISDHDSKDKAGKQALINKMKRRNKSIGTAYSKESGKANVPSVKEDTQLDELSSETKSNYVQKALADRTTADKEARMNISGAKKVGVADPKEGRRLLAIAKAASARRDKRATGISRAKKDDA